MIWDLAQPHRILTLQCRPSALIHDANGNWVGGWLHQPNRILNAVCKESRYQSAKHYKLLLPDLTKGRFSRVDFNQDLDLIYIPAGDPLHIQTWKNYIDGLRAAGSTISKLLIDMDCLDFNTSIFVWSKFVRICESMEEVVFVLGSGPRELSSVIDPNNFLNYDIIGNEWSRRNGATHEDTTRELRTVLQIIETFRQDGLEWKMPIIRIMVMAST